MVWQQLGAWAARIRHPLLVVPLFLAFWFGWQAFDGFGRALLTVGIGAVAAHLLPANPPGDGDGGEGWDDGG